MQAMEAIKLLLNIGKPPLGKLIHYDALNTEFRSFNLRKDPKCPLCGDNPTVTDLIDYDGFCGVPNTSTMKEITVLELKEKIDAGLDGILVDVRTPQEVAAAALDGTLRIPLQEIEARYAEIPTDKTIYVHCKAGGRSAKACAFLAAQGITNTVNIKGGIDAWRDLIDPSLPPS
jgi:adenylyltransferase/sulfurtransferase